MTHRTLVKIAATAAGAVSSVALHAQSPAEPTAYTVTMQYQITGTALRTTYRLGSKVLVDQVPSPGVPPSAPPAATMHTLYFLDTGETLSWDPADTKAACAHGSFQGDAWLDPFAGSADLAMPDVTQLGSEVIHGIATKVLVSKAKPAFMLWVDPKTWLMLKARFTPPSSDKAITYFEVTAVHLEPPPAALFEIPQHCAADLKPLNSTRESK